MKTTLLWHKDKRPKDWDDAWGDLPDEFETPRFYAGDEVCLLIECANGDLWDYTLKVKRVVVDIDFNTKDGKANLAYQWVYVKG